jgi:hypothetical protein
MEAFMTLVVRMLLLVVIQFFLESHLLAVVVVEVE